jgi:hypothetical protein
MPANENLGMKALLPRLDTLPPSQRNLWPALGPLARDFVLYGGTALSLQVGGRQSVDFDFFTPAAVDPDAIVKRYPVLRDASLIQRAQDTASFSLNGPEPVKISFFGRLDFGRVDEPRVFSDNGIVAAGLLDLAAQKVKVVQARAESKDYIDLCTLMNHGVPLARALGAAQTLYPGFNPLIAVKTLSFFGYGDLHLLTKAQREQLTAATREIQQIPVVPKLSDSLWPTDLQIEQEQAVPRRVRAREIERDL